MTSLTPLSIAFWPHPKPVLFGLNTERSESPQNKAFVRYIGLPGLDADFRTQKTYTADLVDQFCKTVGVDGDMNLSHLNGLSKSIAGGTGQALPPTVPGSFLATQITRTFIHLFNQLPSPRTHENRIFPIYVHQSIDYKKPVRAGDTINTQLVVDSIAYKDPKPEAGKDKADLAYWVRTDLSRPNGEQVATGRALLFIRTQPDFRLKGLVQNLSA